MVPEPTEESLEPGDVAAVLLTSGVTTTYDYTVPDHMDAVPMGSFVSVPLGPRDVIGIVWGRARGDVAFEKLKPLKRVYDAPPLTSGFRDFVAWVATYTMAALGRVVRMAMSVPEALEPLKPRIGYVLGDAPLGEKGGPRKTKAREAVLDVVAHTAHPLTVSELAQKADVSDGVVRGLADAGVLSPVTMVEDAFPQPMISPEARPTLSPEQAEAAYSLRQRVEDQAFHVTLLDGVTGSGKTEVYFEAVEQALAQGQQVLVLLPEIALTSQWLSRFEDRFGVTPGLWHSEVGVGARRRLWRAAGQGKAAVIVGARSALFLPFKNLGLIVVDEEHDSSFKQEEGVLYHGRDMAVVRGLKENVPVLLASATPSLETMANVDAGRYYRLALPSRHGSAALPDMRTVNMVATPLERGRWLAQEVVTEITEALARGEQVMLFLNRRGYAPLTLCRTCGHRFECPQCSAWLVNHKAHRKMLCHHCGHQESEPQECPECGSTDSLVPCGPGVERIAEEVKDRFPQARMAILTSDTAARQEDVKGVVSAMENNEVDILVGTQIVAKGYHFPNLTLVGVVDADLGLAGGDLRAAERTYQLLQQVAGRAGRAEKPGAVLLQTYQAHHPVMQALVKGTRDAFYAAEDEARRVAAMPPYSRLVAVVVSGEDLAQVQETAHQLAAHIPRQEGVMLFGPAPAPLALLRRRHRWRLLLKVRRDMRVQAVVTQWLDQTPGFGPGMKGLYKAKNGHLRITVDIDPYSFL